MSVAYVLILDLALVTSMVEHTSARRPHISAEELFQKSTSLQSGSDTAPAAPGEETLPSLVDVAGLPGTAAVATSPCFFNRDCHAREFCVKPDRGALTLGVCSLVPDMASARRGASDHVHDLHFLVRSRRSVAVSPPRRGTNELLRQLLGEGSQLARALNSYLHAKYPAQWEKAYSGRRREGHGRMVDREPADADKDIDGAEDTADPDLLAILDKGSNRIVDTLGDESAVASGSTPTPKGGGRSATPGSPAHDKRNDVVVDVKENDMASGPSRRHMKQPPNSLR